jgi:hypothetical protein
VASFMPTMLGCREHCATASVSMSTPVRPGTLYMTCKNIHLRTEACKRLSTHAQRCKIRSPECGKFCDFKNPNMIGHRRANMHRIATSRWRTTVTNAYCKCSLQHALKHVLYATRTKRQLLHFHHQPRRRHCREAVKHCYSRCHNAAYHWQVHRVGNSVVELHQPGLSRRARGGSGGAIHITNTHTSLFETSGFT